MLDGRGQSVSCREPPKLESRVRHCITMFFSGQNPNENVTFERQGTTQVAGSPTSTSSSGSSISATSWMLAVALFRNVVLVWAIVCGFR